MFRERSTLRRFEGRAAIGKKGLFIGFAWTLVLALLAVPVSAEEDLLDMSLEDLMNVEVTSVSKKAESRNSAAAAVTVISAEDIQRSGMTSIPEVLRLVPGVQVARIDASRWAISIRGFQQEFSNKLLVMIDGRSLYTPLFGGVVWEEQNLSIDDVERIEVVRGPGGTIWGANAVNGVINIISKKAEDTQGIHAKVFGGTQEYGLGVRVGGQVGDATHYRVSLNGEKIEDYDFNQNHNGIDEFGQLRLGLRSDTKISETQEVTVLMDYFDLDREAGGGVSGAGPFFPIVGFDKEHHQQRGGDIVLKYAEDFDDGSHFEAKTYYDRVSRRSTIKEESHTADVELQYNRSLLDHLDVIVGGNYRFWTTHTRPGTGGLEFDPKHSDSHQGSGFIQFRLGLLDDRLALIGGTKVGYNNWSGFEYQPSGRIVIMPTEGHTLWGAVSRAVRTPTFIDRSLEGAIGPITLEGRTDFRSEDLLSYEVGYRYYALGWLTAEISAFWSEYDDISAVTGGAPPATQFFRNSSDVEVKGAEIEVTVVPLDWWRLTAGYSVIVFDEDAAPDLFSSRLTDTNANHQVMGRSVFDLPGDVEFDVAAFWVDGREGTTPTLRPKNVQQYVRLDLRIAWKPLDFLEIALVGQNLIDSRHAEFNDVQRNQSTQVPRSGYAKVTVDF